MKKIYLIIILLPLSLFSNDFQQGNIKFTNKNYDEAIDHYQKDMDTNGYSIETLYNLSNIYQQLDKHGHALYYLYKARVINPMEKYIETDIKVIEEALELENNYNHLLPIPYFLIDLILPISILLLTISLAIFVLNRQLKLGRIVKYTVYLFILFVITSLTMKLYTISKSSDVIVLEDSSVQLSPYESSDVTFNIIETSIITVSDEFEDYYYITDKNERYGWIRKDMVGEIWK